MKFKVCGVDCESDKEVLTAGEILMLAWKNEAFMHVPTNDTRNTYYRLGLGEISFDWDNEVALQEGARFYITLHGPTRTA